MNRNSRFLNLFIVLLAGLCLVGKSNAAVVLFFEDFQSQSSPNYTSYGSFSDGDNDYSMRIDALSRPNGLPAYQTPTTNAFWGVEDVDAPENPAGVAIIQFSEIVLDSSFDVVFSLQVAAGSTTAFDGLDDFLIVEYRINSGPWTTALSLQNDGSQFNSALSQDNDFDGIGDGPPLSLAFQEIASDPISLPNSLMDVRIDAYFNADEEAVAFDNFRIVAIPEPSQIALFLGILLLCFKVCSLCFQGTEPCRS
jgi:hypothetical protein